VSLRAAGGEIVTGSYVENAAYNPSLSPMLAALNAARFRTLAWEDVVEVTLVETRRAVEATGGISQEGHCRAVAARLLPNASVTVVRCD
jgi:cytidine deaminase